jgi:hypothetical protein
MPNTITIILDVSTLSVLFLRKKKTAFQNMKIFPPSYAMTGTDPFSRTLFEKI